MILCPFCQTPVLDTIKQQSVEDGHASDCYCPNYITIQAPNKENPVGKRICHFSRRQLKHLVNSNPVYSYQAIIPPFQIAWMTGKKVAVYKLDPEGDRIGDPIFQAKQTSTYQDFLHACQRFKNLVVFS